MPDGSLRRVAAGDIIGRMPSAAVFLDDERVSEAHALISLRGPDLKVLSLRGRQVVDDKPATEAVLEEGMVIEPAPGLELAVAGVELPDTVMALQGPGLPRQIVAGTTSLVRTPRPALIQRYVGDAAAWVWPVGDGWRVRVGAGAPQPLSVGDTIDVGDLRIEAVTEALAAAARQDTRATPTEPLPMTIVARYDVVHVWADGGVEAHFDGLLARIVSELAVVGAPVEWEGVAGVIWPKESDHVIG